MSRSPYVASIHYEPKPDPGYQRRNNMSQRDEVQKFEQGRIRVLQEERLHIQKKTFTKWMNSFLQKARMEVEDLFVDLADGKKLLKLLEIISGEKLAKPNNGRMRVHKIENVNKSLAFLHTKVRLESIGAEDIVDGNPRLILGLIWTIILRFQIQEIEIPEDEDNESSEKKSAKDALLLWAQRKTHGYPDVHISDFSSSWRNGLGFNALIHAHRPDLFEFESLKHNKNIDNLNHAFDIAQNELGILRLLDAEDIDTSRPDEKSIMTYVASYYHTFARMKQEEKSGRRIAKIIKQMIDSDKLKLTYDKLTTDLLDWIKLKIVELEDRQFPNSLEGIQNLFIQFGHYRNQEKPPKYIERSEIEALFFNINTQLKELRQPAFYPSDGKLVQDIERSWDTLEKAEHSREVALREELMRQQRLDQLMYKFEKKSILREGYLKEMIQVLSDPRYGSNLVQVDATLKKHEAISADILAREERIHDLSHMAQELINENYRNSDRVQKRESEIIKQWEELKALLEKHKLNLNKMGSIMSIIREIDSVLTSTEQLRIDLSSTDTGAHLVAVEELLHKHALQNLMVTSLEEKESWLNRVGHQTAQGNPKGDEVLKKLKELGKVCEEIRELSAKRKALLEEARNFYQFLQDQEDEEAWLIEKQRICQAGIMAKDLRGVLSLQQKHKVLMDEIKTRKNKFDQLGATSKQLISDNHPRSLEIQQHVDKNKKNWELLDKLAKERAKQLQDAAEAYQFYADANEAESWLNEKLALVTSDDYGTDELSAKALLQRHKVLDEEINAYHGDIYSLNGQADRLVASGISTLDLNNEPEVNEPIEDVQYENRMVPTEVWVDEPVEKTEYKVITEEKKVPQVKALYPFNDHGLSMVKNEVMFLLNKSNPDWWCVRKADGTDGFAPANYVEEIEPRIILVNIRKPEVVKSVQKVKKTKLVNTKVPVKVLRQLPRAQKRKVDDTDSVPKRQKTINDSYAQLQDLAAKRQALLADAVKLFTFYKECDDFEKWIKDKEQLLANDDPNDSIEQAKRKYEKFLTDLSASQKRMDALDADVKVFVNQNHSQIDKVKIRHRQIQAAWQKLNTLKAQKEKSLEGASSVELFNKICEETKDWMLEKMEQLDTAVLGHDLKTIQALQRRHDNLERELSPIEEKVDKVNLLGNSVQKSYPNEKANVIQKQKDIDDLWKKVKDKALERRTRIEDAVGQQIFTNSSKHLLNWVADTKKQLNADNVVRDVQTAEALLKAHQDLAEDIKAKNDEFKQVTGLGKKLLKSNPNLPEVQSVIDRLLAEQEAIARGWKEKDIWLQQCLELQIFNKEADNIDAVTSGHQAFLEFDELGSSLDEVEALHKQHRAFANTLAAQDDRLNAFAKKANTLIAKQHYDAAGIADRVQQVLERRQAVKDASQKRADALDASKNYQEFCAEVYDLRAWMAEKIKTASDENYRDLSNLERKIQKHEAFERELRSNEGQLRTINKLGMALIAQDSYRKNEVGKTLKELNDEWQRLVDTSLQKGRMLRQAVTQHEYNKSIEDVNNKLNEINEKMNSKNVGSDLRSCRELMKHHDALESDIAFCATRIEELRSQSQNLHEEGHFDSPAIIENVEAILRNLQELNAPSQDKRAILEESLEFHKFGFSIDAELQWIKEHLPLASSQDLGQNLHQAQNLYKKHKKLEAEIIGHQPVIDKTLETGQALIDKDHPEEKQIQVLCNTLEEAWQDLKDKTNARAQQLNTSLKAQQFFFEINEVESWLNEKDNVLASTDFGRDRDSATKLLSKHKALELELDTYNNIISEMGHGAQAMIKSGHPESKLIAERQTAIEHLARAIQRKAVTRQQKLMESLFRHEYFVESEELESWIAENLQQASSEDYGQDYEHLLQLQTKFDDLKHRIEGGFERYRQCEDLAQKLLANESPYSAEIENRQDNLEQAWEQLQTQLTSREERLEAAGQIHRFHRDIADALQRIQEKNAALGTDLGRNLNSALTLLRKHEAFENELVVLEAQLQILVEDASKLKKLYPNNKVNIQHQQEVVVAAWNDLKERTDLRRDQLQASVDLQKFLAQVRDLSNWANGLILAMNAEENIRSASRVQVVKSEHEALKSEIDAREDDFQEVAENLAAMEQTGHYAAPEAVEKYKHLIGERDKLLTTWQLRKIHLDQLCDLLVFLRETKLIEDATNTQEAALTHVDIGETVDEVSNQLKKHEEFEKVLQVQDKNLEALFASGNKLLQQNHFESEQIAQRLADVQAKRKKVHQLSEAKRKYLTNGLLYAEFVRDVAETQVWIIEKEKKLGTMTAMTKSDVSDLEDKIKVLQKHQAFQAEVVANAGRIQEIKNNGETLIRKNHKASQDIADQLADLEQAWRRLNEEVSLKGKGLEEAQDILEFNSQLDKIESWIRDKEVLLQAGDTGKDYEHCQILQRKLDDVDSDMKIDDTKIKTITALSNKLAAQGHNHVRERGDNLIKKWHSLQKALNDYRNKLNEASEIHLFDRDIADTLDRIAEKCSIMESEEVGRNLPAVEALQRKQEALENEISAIENKIVNTHQKDAFYLSEKYPYSTKHLEDTLRNLEVQMQKLEAAKLKRRALLQKAHSQEKFLADAKQLEQWVLETIKRMESQEKPNSVVDAEVQLELHNELKAEIAGRDEPFTQLIQYGKTCPEKDNPIIVDNVKKLEELHTKIHRAWIDHKNNLTHSFDVQEFNEQVNQLNNWLADKEAFLNNEDVGDTPRAVEALLRKHNDFELTLQTLLGRVDELKSEAKRITKDTSRNNEEVLLKLETVLNRNDRLLAKTKQRKDTLEKSKALQDFLRNVNDVETWLTQKLQTAADENYREPINLQNKIQKHATFEAEVIASGERIQNVVEVGKDLIAADHYAADEIGIRLDELENDWKHLLELSNLKRDRLNEAYQALLFNRSLEEFETWLTDVEHQLKITGTDDFTSAGNHLKRLATLENDIQQHAENCEIINEGAEQFKKGGHFLADEIDEKVQKAITRYHQLKEPLQVKKDQLELSSMLQQFTRDVDDELQWLDDREPLVASQDLGNNLTAVQHLHKKHQILEGELTSRSAIIDALVARADQLVRSKHPSETIIKDKTEQLNVKLDQVKDLASIRRLRLQDSLEVQAFYQDVSEAQAWIIEKRPLLATKEVGKDEDTAKSLQRKLETLSIEVKTFQKSIQRIVDAADSLIARRHFDAANIEKVKVELQKDFGELRKLVSEREVRLAEALQYFGFVHECNEVQDWMKEQMNKADSEEYGNDLEHVELLIQAFDTFHASLINSEPRVQQCIENGHFIIDAKSSYSPDIQQKIIELQNNWDDLLELANARKEALAGAKQVHLFDQTADEIISWIREKDIDVIYGVYVPDVEVIEDMMRKHQALETEMKAIKDKVDFVEQEGDRLIAEYPDTKEHIDDKREDTVSTLQDLQDKVERQKYFLQQSEQLQSYFDEYHDLLAWINEMLAKITAPDLPQDCIEAELLLGRHKEYSTEIDGRLPVFQQFYETGQTFIKEGHSLSQEIEDKIKILKQKIDLLDNTWKKRNLIYEQNLDLQLFKRDANVLENWMAVREGTLKDGKVGDTISQVEEFIRKHRDFEETIKAQDSRFNALKRQTLLEDSFAQQKLQEARARKEEKERIEQEKLEQRKLKEKARINELRRQESLPRYSLPEDARPVISHEQLEALQQSTQSPAENNNISIRKTNSIAHTFDRDRIRRGSDVSVKRAESMKVGNLVKPVKRTPSFNTRRRGSIRSKNELVLPPVEAEAFLERKQLLLPGQKRATNRAWKHSYTVLCGQLLCFFKTKDDFVASKANAAPLNIHNATCGIADDYQKRKHTFRLSITDGSEFLFASNSEVDMMDWINKITFRAKLPPANQLQHFEITKDPNDFEISSQSSRTSSPDVPDTVVLRQDPHATNGSISSSTNHPYRHTIGGSSSPPPIPPRMTDVTLGYESRLYTSDSSGSVNEGFNNSTPSRGQEWNSTSRPLSSPDSKNVSHRIRDLFVRKKRNSQM
ncbi:spectrin beta chain, non-erythrocytic 1 isoform X1 [Diabrotica virgifera virgifera]|uniref:Spectrin beta chain, non-erythrocytic 1 isoform X1 n=2 Tax=Diabrotica virgifera virgifera TaxID=50390 RepID=A0A6P7G1V7_DIAVI|nr:spectrin beta chain, non-erythrocytic 1 isoform X1 [Diabrotica virgifera virgifera]